MRTFRVRVSDKSFVVEVDDIDKSPLQVIVNGRPYQVEVEWEGATSEATVRPEIVPAKPASEAIEPPAKRPSQPPKPHVSDAERTTALTVDAPMPGSIVAISVRPGDSVARGDEVCVLEAMKMQHTITAPADGTVTAVFFAKGEQVQDGVNLIEFEKEQESGVRR